MTLHQIEIEVDGDIIAAEVEGRLTLGDFLRHQAGRTGVHMGCEHGVCGACTVSLNGEAVRSCLMLAVQADGARIGTIHGLAETDGTLHPVQAAMQAEYALQCGFCTPGVVMTLASVLAAEKTPSEERLRDVLSGHLCRCTGYQGMLRVARSLAAQAREQAASGAEA